MRSVRLAHRASRDWHGGAVAGNGVGCSCRWRQRYPSVGTRDRGKGVADDVGFHNPRSISPAKARAAREARGDVRGGVHRASASFGARTMLREAPSVAWRIKWMRVADGCEK